MGQQPNKYHITDDGKVFRINDDGSFTSVGNIEDIEKVHSTSVADSISTMQTSSGESSKHIIKGRLNLNYNWLWLTTIIIFVGWYISCLSCSWPYYPIYDESGHIVNYFHADNFGDILCVSIAIQICFALSWFFSSKDKLIYKILQIPLVVCSGWGVHTVYWLCEQQYSFFLLCLAIIPFMIWIIVICVSLFGRKRV